MLLYCAFYRLRLTWLLPQMVRRVPQRLPQRKPQAVQGLSVQGLNTAVLLAMTAAIQVAIQMVHRMWTAFLVHRMGTL